MLFDRLSSQERVEVYSGIEERIEIIELIIYTPLPLNETTQTEDLKKTSIQINIVLLHEH